VSKLGQRIKLRVESDEEEQPRYLILRQSSSFGFTQ